MFPQPKQPSPPTLNHAEFEWLLCLSAARQARELQSAKIAAGHHHAPQPRFLHGLRALMKGLHKSRRNRAA
jgi:hypothetical protein